MTKQELLDMSLESEEKGFANIRSLQAGWNQDGIVLLVWSRPFKTKTWRGSRPLLKLVSSRDRRAT